MVSVIILLSLMSLLASHTEQCPAVILIASTKHAVYFIGLQPETEVSNIRPVGRNQPTGGFKPVRFINSESEKHFMLVVCQMIYH